MDTRTKLSLIEEHAREYYDSPREYRFIYGGFIQYSLGGQRLCITDMFVTKSQRTGETLRKLIGVIKSLVEVHSVTECYCRVDISNSHVKSLSRLYRSNGFVHIRTDPDFHYFKWSKNDTRR